MGAVISFFRPAPTTQGNWSQQELAEFYRVEAALIRAGLRITSEQGLSDEADPWFVFCEPDGEAIMHFARIDGSYVVASDALDHAMRGPDFRALLNQIAEQYPSLLPIPRPGAGTKLVVHPAALLAAIVAAAALALSSGDAAAHELEGLEPASEAGPGPLRGAGHRESAEKAAPPAKAEAPGQSREPEDHRKLVEALILSAMLFAAESFAADPLEHGADAASLFMAQARAAAEHAGLDEGAQSIDAGGGSGRPGASLLQREAAVAPERDGFHRNPSVAGSAPSHTSQPVRPDAVSEGTAPPQPVFANLRAAPEPHLLNARSVEGEAGPDAASPTPAAGGVEKASSGSAASQQATEEGARSTDLSQDRSDHQGHQDGPSSTIQSAHARGVASNPAARSDDERVPRSIERADRQEREEADRQAASGRRSESGGENHSTDPSGPSHGVRTEARDRDEKGKDGDESGPNRGRENVGEADHGTHGSNGQAASDRDSGPPEASRSRGAGVEAGTGEARAREASADRGSEPAEVTQARQDQGSNGGSANEPAEPGSDTGRSATQAEAQPASSTDSTRTAQAEARAVDVQAGDPSQDESSRGSGRIDQAADAPPRGSNGQAANDQGARAADAVRSPDPAASRNADGGPGIAEVQGRDAHADGGNGQATTSGGGGHREANGAGAGGPEPDNPGTRSETGSEGQSYNPGAPRGTQAEAHAGDARGADHGGGGSNRGGAEVAQAADGPPHGSNGQGANGRGSEALETPPVDLPAPRNAAADARGGEAQDREARAADQDHEHAVSPQGRGHQGVNGAHTDPAADNPGSGTRDAQRAAATASEDGSAQDRSAAALDGHPQSDRSVPGGDEEHTGRGGGNAAGPPNARSVSGGDDPAGRGEAGTSPTTSAQSAHAREHPHADHGGAERQGGSLPASVDADGNLVFGGGNRAGRQPETGHVPGESEPAADVGLVGLPIHHADHHPHLQ